MNKDGFLKASKTAEIPNDLEKVLSGMLERLNINTDELGAFGSRNAEWLAEKHIERKLTTEEQLGVSFLFRLWSRLEDRRKHKAEILKVLELAAEDNKVLAQLVDNPAEVLNKFDLTVEERAALTCGDVKFIEEITGKLTEKQKTWLNCRLQQEKW